MLILILCMCVFFLEDTLRAKNGVFCGSSLEERQTEKNHSVTGPSCPGTPTTQ